MPLDAAVKQQIMSDYGTGDGVKAVFAAEGSSDLRARGAQIYVRDAAVAAARREEVLRMLQSIGEDRRG